MSGRWLRRRVVCAALALVGALAAAPPATAATDDPELPVTVQITEVSPSILRPGEPLRVLATLTNDGDEVIEAPGAALRLSRFRVFSRADVDAWASAGTDGLSKTRRDVTTPVAEPLLPGASVTVELELPADRVGLLKGADTWGPRGLVVEALDGSRRVGIQRTFLLWLTTDDVPQTDVSVLVPIVGPPADPAGADESVAELEALTRTGGRLHDLAAVVTADGSVGAAIDPALIDAATAGTPSTQAWATDLTGRLRSHDVVALPWSDPDIAAAAHAQQPDLVQLAVDRTAQTGIPGLTTTSGVLWAPGTDAPDEATAGVTAQVGADAIVLPPFTDKDAKTTPGASVRAQTAAGAINAFQPDATLTSLLTAPDDVEPGATTATTVQRALAELAVITRESDEQPHLLLAPGRAWEPDLPNVSALLAAFTSAPWVRLAPVSGLLDTAEPEARTTLPSRTTDPDELGVAGVRALADARTDAVAFAQVTSEPATLLEGVDTEVLAPLSVAWRTDPAGRDELVTSVVADVDARTSGLSIAPVSDFRVIAASSAVSIVVQNALAVPATVLVDVDPRTACLEVGEIPEVRIDAESEASVRIPLRARANCSVEVTARLTAPDGLAVSPTVRFTALVAPTIESIGTIVVGVLLALGLVLGIIRTVRRGQSARRGARTEAEADAPTSLPVLGGTVADETTPAEDPR
ncbi:DUF6049 family protein [Cellulomonas sp.]|uniref:DUF6049 family protein n=1 Tax=Cellulomonas sp. TaxID=40001 RepID=UPI003BAA4047